MNARYYDPSTGTFLSRDSFQGFPYLPSSLNRYAYVANNPVNMKDPTGHWGGVDDLIALGSGALIGGGASIISQYLNDNGHVDWGTAAIDTATGALAGEATLYCGPAALACVAGAGAAAGMVSSTAEQYYHNGQITDPGQVLASGSLEGPAHMLMLGYSLTRPTF